MKIGIKKALMTFGCTPAISSLIYMNKNNCITKEKHDEMYKTNEETEERMDLSIGEDLETFIGRIKNGKINKDTIPNDVEDRKTFLLCLLDKEEKKNLNEKKKASWQHSTGTFYINMEKRQMFQKLNGSLPSRI